VARLDAGLKVAKGDFHRDLRRGLITDPDLPAAHDPLFGDSKMRWCRRAGAISIKDLLAVTKIQSIFSMRIRAGAGAATLGLFFNFNGTADLAADRHCRCRRWEPTRSQDLDSAPRALRGCNSSSARDAVDVARQNAE